ncbi:MAG: sulfatase [bacterium]|nr:sulfatase [bacterium]
MRATARLSIAYSFWLALVLAVLLVWRARSSRPNIIIILVDALRRDHVGCYGYHRDITPSIDDLARSSIIFDTAIAQATSTKMSVGSLFSSLYPSVHTAIENQGHGMTGDVLPSNVRTLAEVLRDHGYMTIGVSGNPHVSPVFGFDQGFMLFKCVDYFGDQASVNADLLTDLALKSVLSNPGRPYFLYLHYMNTHAPYALPPPYDSMFVDTRKGSPTEAAILSQWMKVCPYLATGDRRTDVVAEDVPPIIDRYDGTIAYTDACVGRLLATLEGENKLRNTIIVLLADHGEEFLEHGNIGHVGTLYDELIRIPMILRMPQRRHAGRRILDIVEVVDLFPTILEYAGVGFDADDICGRSLMGLIKDGTPVRSDAYSEHYQFARSLRTVRHKYIYPRVSSVKEQLFDLESDPRECGNIASVHADLVGHYKAMVEGRAADLDEMRNRLGIAGESVAIGEGTREILRALGYIN